MSKKRFKVTFARLDQAGYPLYTPTVEYHDSYDAARLRASALGWTIIDCEDCGYSTKKS